VRVLASVPGASEMCNAFLALHARCSSLEMLKDKLSEQVLALQVRAHTPHRLRTSLKRAGDWANRDTGHMLSCVCVCALMRVRGVCVRGKRAC
jgi:hypothetical protein